MASQVAQQGEDASEAGAVAKEEGTLDNFPLLSVVCGFLAGGTSLVWFLFFWKSWEEYYAFKTLVPLCFWGVLLVALVSCILGLVGFVYGMGLLVSAS